MLGLRSRCPAGGALTGVRSLWREQEALGEFQSKFIFMCSTDEAFPVEDRHED